MKQQIFFPCILLLLLIASGSYGQYGYLYVHKKTINEESSVNSTFTLKNNVTAATQSFILNDHPGRIFLVDIGAGHTAPGGANADGELWAIGDTSGYSNTGPVYHRAAGSSQWEKIAATAASDAAALDGAYANQFVYTTAAGIYFYNAGSITQLYSGAVRDVAAGGGHIAAVMSDGSVNSYSATYAEGVAPSAAGTWNAIDYGANADRLDVMSDGSAVVYISGHIVQSMPVSGGMPTLIGGGAVGGGTGWPPDVAVDDNGVVYALTLDGVSFNTIVFNNLAGTAWTKEVRSENRDRITGGTAGQIWGIYNGLITTRETSQNNIYSGANATWYDDERVHTASEGQASFAGIGYADYGNSIMLRLPAGSYTLKEIMPDATWDLRRIQVYDPTNNTTIVLDSSNAVINIAAGEIVTADYVSEKLATTAIPNVCGTNLLETFGSGSALFSATPCQGTAYHYSNIALPKDGSYILTKEVTNSTWYGTTALTDHTGDTNGYFLFVNASYAADEFYRKRISGLAIGQTYTFSFWTANISPWASILPNFKFGIQDLSGNTIGSVSTGDISSVDWIQYTLTIVATSTAADIFIANNTIGGTGNDLAIDDIAFNLAAPATPVPTAFAVANTCPVNYVDLNALLPTAVAGQTYEWQAAAPYGIVCNPASVSASDSFILVSKLDGTGCYSAPSATVTTAITGCSGIITGKVWNDDNADALPDATESGTNAGTALYVYLVDGTGEVISKSAVDANGNYSVTGLNNTSYTLRLSANGTYAVNSIPAAIDVTPPAGWVTTGENSTGDGNFTGASDGNPDGIISINTGSYGLSNQNFGIEQPPVTGSGINSAVNPGGTAQLIVPAGTFTNITASSDSGPGTVTGIRLTAFPTNVTDITIDGITYSGFTGALQNLVIPADATGAPLWPIAINPSFSGSGNCEISFLVLDNGNIASANTGTAVMQLNPGVPVSGNIFNDVNGNSVQDGAEQAATTGTQLYVYLADAAGNIADSAFVAPDGSYIMEALPNSTYTLLLSTTAYPIGNNTVQYPISTVLPPGWMNTGENNNGTGDGTPDGKLIISTGTTADTNLNFGINEIPVTGSGINAAVNPGGNTSVTVPPSTFTNIAASNDPSANGMISSLHLTAFPTNASGITINGVVYTSFTTALQNLHIPTDDHGNPAWHISIDPSDTGTVESVISFVVRDNAGADATNTGTAVMDFGVGVDISGTVFTDANGNTIAESGENGTSGPAQSYIYLIDNKGNILDSAFVNSDGTYILTGLSNADYSLILSQQMYAIGSDTTTSPIDAAAPSGWVNTGENGTGTADGNADGKLSVATATCPATGQNFGIEQLPVTDDKTYNNMPVAAFSTAASNGFPAITGYRAIFTSNSAFSGYASGNGLSGSDPEDCNASSSCSTGKTFVIKSINANTLLYYDFGGATGIRQLLATPADTIIPAFDPAGLRVYSNGTTGTGFKYSLLDAAGYQSTTPASFSLTIAVNPLPVKLADFTAMQRQCSALLTWKTAQEEDLDHFEVLYSNDGSRFIPLTGITPKGSGSSYDFTYAQPEGPAYYKLKMVEKNADINYSNTAKVTVSCPIAPIISIRPNPAHDQLIVTTGNHTTRELQLFDMTGQLLMAQSLQQASTTIDISALTPGCYIAAIKEQGRTILQLKLVKE